MKNKILKIIFWSWKSNFLFVFFAVFLSLFSYLLATNIIYSVKDYTKWEIKPIVWWDIVLSSKKQEVLDDHVFNNYKNNFEIAKTINFSTTIFNKNKPILIDLVFKTDNYPFYNSFEYDIINNSWQIIVSKDIYDKIWDNIKILDKNYSVFWIINKEPIWVNSLYSNWNTIYLSINNFKTDYLKNSRLDIKYYFKFINNYDIKLINKIKSDKNFSNFNVKTIDDRDENISNVLDRFFLYINFFNLVIFTITFFVIILSLETYFKKIKNYLWLLNIFWLTKKKIFLYNFFIISTIFIFWFIISFLWVYLFLSFLNNYFWIFEVYFWSFIKWIIITFILIIIWSFLPFYKLFKQNTSDLLKNNKEFTNFKAWDYLIYITLIFLWFFSINVVWWISLFYSLIFWILFVLIIISFYFVLNFTLNFIFKKVKTKNFYLYDTIRSTIKPWNVSFLIVFSSLISFLSIFVFLVFSWSFLNYLNNLTSTSRDVFVLNVQQNNISFVKKYLKKDEIYEIINSRIIDINWLKLDKFLWVKEVSREYSREFFSTTNSLTNKIISWKKLEKWSVSVDYDFANRIGLKIWDEINFSFAWINKTLRVINFREAVRNWADPFFFFQFDKNDFNNFPKSYILSYKKSQKPAELSKILQDNINSSLTFIDVWDIIKIVLEISSKILIVVYFCLIYIFIFAILSFYVCILFLKSFKEYKIELLNILWWELNKLNFYLKFEYLYLSFLSVFISFIFWSLFLIIIFYFIKYFSISTFYYFLGILVLIMLFLLLNIKIIIKK